MAYLSNTVNAFLRNSLARYLVIGGLSYLIEITLLLLFHEVLGLSTLLAVSVAFWIGLLISFYLQKTLAFGSKTTHKRTSQQLALYLLLIGLNYTVTILIVEALEVMTGLVIARTLALLLTTVWNYIIYKKIIFKT